MAMVEKFNALMKGFIDGDITHEWLSENPEGILRNGSSFCRYKLRDVEGSKVLGAYGVSRFTNWRFHEITEDGDIRFEWYLQEMFVAGDPESERKMHEHNHAGFQRVKDFGLEGV